MKINTNIQLKSKLVITLSSFIPSLIHLAPSAPILFPTMIERIRNKRKQYSTKMKVNTNIPRKYNSVITLFSFIPSLMNLAPSSPILFPTMIELIRKRKKIKKKVNKCQMSKRQQFKIINKINTNIPRKYNTVITLFSFIPSLMHLAPSAPILFPTMIERMRNKQKVMKRHKSETQTKITLDKNESKHKHTTQIQFSYYFILFHPFTNEFSTISTNVIIYND